MKHLRLYTLILILFSSTALWAQQGQDEEENIGWESSFHVGNMLPDQIEGVTEITPQWGIRIGFPNNKKKWTTEWGIMTGKGEGIEWSTLSLSLRIDYPIEEMLGMFYIGLDGHSYLIESTEERISSGGGHMGGGIMAHIGDALWFRADMKFNVNPGTSLYFGFGFNFRIPGEEDTDEKKE